MTRKFSRPVKRVVVKVGSGIIANYKLKPRKTRLGSLVEQMSVARQNGIEVVFVSSGAIVLGMGEVGMSKRPNDLVQLQSLAATGQTVLMKTYSDLFHRRKMKCAQILLTWEDFDDRKRYNNARNTLCALLEQGVVPIINENDTISTDEIKFGDNDKLSALVASLVGADLLLILSDVEGLYKFEEGKKTFFKEIEEITPDIEALAFGTTKKNISKGGMSAKLNAIKIAVQAKVPCVIAHGEVKDVLTRVLNGERVGTFFCENEEKLLSRKHWISFGGRPKGILIVDEGAEEALLEGGKSLLLPGIKSWDGHFKKNDIVIVCNQSRQEIARGIIAYSVSDLHNITDKKGKREVIHRDELVLCKR
ncbi:MAG: glutamate 5-kinase [Candidatus Omnitrophota bacterium]